MKRIFFIYRINYSKPSGDIPQNNEPTETCITLPMKDEIAHDILKNGSESQYLQPMGDVRIVLEQICELQGCSFGDVVSVEEV